jgi:8-oxo-dGTP diphosphatase
VRSLRRLLERGAPATLCSHGPVLPALLDDLAGLVDEDSDDGADAAKMLDQAAESGMGKGEVLVTHLVGTGADARVVAVERHLP